MSRENIKLTKALISNAAPSDTDYVIWDTEVRGFGLRVLPSARKSFVFQYRIGRVSKKLTLGSGELSLSLMRDLARQAAGKVAAGIDPGKERDDLRNRVTIAELVERFDVTHITFHVKASTAKEYRRAIQLYILPAFGTMHVADVTRSQIHAFHQKMKNKPTQANRTLEILSKMFNLAEEWEYRAPNTNPRKGIKKYPETKRERFLSAAELERVGEVLAEMEDDRIEMPSAIAAVRLLMFTGCRLNEIMMLDWRHVDLKAALLRLPDSKTGAKNVQLGAAAVAVLRSITRIEDNPWVLTGKLDGGRLTDLQPFWQRVRSRAGLNDARIHDLRHTFASIAVADGMPLYSVGKLLGHASTQTTARYAHLGAGTMQVAADRVSSLIAGHMPKSAAEMSAR
ncbi:tyrosine-type recombinase/integrase [Sphingomonas sp.]|uniref:tyrosine-type recombinase/integrase n=1 Tax=Sphingomonas sp. TaxID=28214 RepID=UPI003B007BA9